VVEQYRFGSYGIVSHIGGVSLLIEKKLQSLFTVDVPRLQSKSSSYDDNAKRDRLPNPSSNICICRLVVKDKQQQYMNNFLKSI